MGGVQLPEARAIVVVEGASDRSAVEALAKRRGRDLTAEGVAVVAIGGAQAIGRFLDVVWRPARGVELAGLCDVGEERHFRRALERAGLGADLERAGFFVCDRDLEDELIRAIGTDAVEAIVEAEGDLTAFRTLQKQPEWRGRPTGEQLHRFMGSGGSRKVRYARLLVEALDPARVPRPLDGVLARV